MDLNNGTSDADGWCYASTAEDLLEGKGGDQSLVASGKRRVRMRFVCRHYIHMAYVVSVC